MKKSALISGLLLALAAGFTLGLGGCSASDTSLSSAAAGFDSPTITQQKPPTQTPPGTSAQGSQDAEPAKEKPTPSIPIIEDMRPGFVHGDKGDSYQKYIVLHDTEGTSNPASVIDWWDGNGNLVASHFIVGIDGTVYQCVPLDKIAHHAGYGDAGHNSQYGISEDGRDDMAGSTWVGDWAPDYGMNAWSVGIEMVHVGGSGYYPEEQLEALDALIAYIDSYYGIQSTIIDHKAWRSGNSDTSPEFSEYLYSYQTNRKHRA